MVGRYAGVGRWASLLLWLQSRLSSISGCTGFPRHMSCSCVWYFLVICSLVWTRPSVCRRAWVLRPGTEYRTNRLDGELPWILGNSGPGRNHLVDSTRNSTPSAPAFVCTEKRGHLNVGVWPTAVSPRWCVCRIILSKRRRACVLSGFHSLVLGLAGQPSRLVFSRDQFFTGGDGSRGTARPAVSTDQEVELVPGFDCRKRQYTREDVGQAARLTTLDSVT